MSSERTPLLQRGGRGGGGGGVGGAEGSQSYQNYLEDSRDPHDQFCALVGVPSSNLPPGVKEPKPRPTSLYKRATRERYSQNITYMITASLSNTLLLTQVVLGATLTALGASESSHILITIFGVINTVIAGLVAYLKSRGQPMRARMYRDDMDRVVDEIENSEVMWLGISKGVLGYEEINTDGEVTVRSEVARLTRLYDRAVKTNTMNNPDIYMAGGGLDGSQQGLKARPVPAQPPVPAPAPAVPVANAPAAVPVPAAAAAAEPDPDESPATKAKPTPPPSPLPPPPKASSDKASKDDKKATPGEHPPSTGDSKGKDTEHAELAPSDAPEKPDESPADTLKDSTQAGPSAAETTTTTTTPKPTGEPDDILDDPGNPTIHVVPPKKKKTRPNGASS